MDSIAERFPLPEIPEQAVGITPEEQFAGDIAMRVSRLSETIDNLIDKRVTSPYKLMIIEDRRNTFAQHAAVYRLLRQRGLLTRYFEDEDAFRSTPNGWEVVLDRPLPGKNLTEEFRIESRDPVAGEDDERHMFILKYRLRRS